MIFYEQRLRHRRYQDRKIVYVYKSILRDLVMELCYICSFFNYLSFMFAFDNNPQKGTFLSPILFFKSAGKTFLSKQGV